MLIKQSPRTPRCADHFAEAFAAAGAPEGLVQVPRTLDVGRRTSEDGSSLRPSIQRALWVQSESGGDSESWYRGIVGLTDTTSGQGHQGRRSPDMAWHGLTSLDADLNPKPCMWIDQSNVASIVRSFTLCRVRV